MATIYGKVFHNIIMLLIYDKVSYVAPYQKPWQSLKVWPLLFEHFAKSSC